MSVRIKRIYEPPDASDGTRVLVDRLWPRGLARAKAKVDRWEKELAPSDELRRWFGHDPAKWAEFRKRYRAELSALTGLVRELAVVAGGRGRLTLLYAARDERHNNAVVLAEVLKKRKRVSRAKSSAPARVAKRGGKSVPSQAA
jgi:uncharacterized protein YeaO (DUF488 family)